MAHLSRRAFLGHAASAAGIWTAAPLCAAAGRSFGKDRPLMSPVFQAVVCPWRSEHPRHDHQLIFPLDAERLMLVWSEYYSTADMPQTEKGETGATDEVSCQIASKISTDRGRTWGGRKVLQPNKVEAQCQASKSRPALGAGNPVLLRRMGFDNGQERLHAAFDRQRPNLGRAIPNF